MTKNFTDAEWACKHCQKRGVHPVMESILQILRDLVGVPIILNSGYRCPEHPAERNKPKGSIGRHQQGIAADVWSPKMPLQALYNAARETGLFHGIGVNRAQNFIHLDCRPKAEAYMWYYGTNDAIIKWDGNWESLPKG